MSPRLTSVLCRALFVTTVFTSGTLSLTGCGGSNTAPVNTPGAAPVDNDEATRQKAMENFMKNESTKKK